MQQIYFQPIQDSAIAKARVEYAPLETLTAVDINTAVVEKHSALVRRT